MIIKMSFKKRSNRKNIIHRNMVHIVKEYFQTSGLLCWSVGVLSLPLLCFPSCKPRKNSNKSLLVGQNSGLNSSARLL